jgi:hypothetical protein
LKWASERHKNLSNIHCLLIRNGDTLNYRPLVQLRYGDDYQDLAPYLKTLLDDPSQPTDVSDDASAGESCE